MILLSAVGYLSAAELPTATRCFAARAQTCSLKSIYEHTLGSDFSRLHPEIQRRFGFSSVDKIASIGTGVMEKIWHGPLYTLPFLYVGSWRSIMFPESGEMTFRFRL